MVYQTIQGCSQAPDPFTDWREVGTGQFMMSSLASIAVDSKRWTCRRTKEGGLGNSGSSGLSGQEASSPIDLCTKAEYHPSAVWSLGHLVSHRWSQQIMAVAHAGVEDLKGSCGGQCCQRQKFPGDALAV